MVRENPKVLDSFLVSSPNLERWANGSSSANDPINYADSQRLSDIPDTGDRLIQRSDAWKKLKDWARKNSSTDAFSHAQSYAQYGNPGSLRC